MALSPLFRPVTYDDLPGWRADDPSGAYDAFRRSAFHVLTKPYRTGSLGVDHAAFAEAFAKARQVEKMTAEQARDFFERHFVPAWIASDETPTPDLAGASRLSRPSFGPPQGGGGLACGSSPSPLRGGIKGGGSPDKLNGFVTGFYEPEADASLVRTSEFTVPLLSRPADLVDIDDTNRPAGMDPYLAFARRTPDGALVEYHDRAAIDAGALAGQELEIAWLRDKVDVFFIHVQGAARLRLPDGSLRRVTYAAKAGHRFTGIGRVLADMGEIPLAEVTMQSIRAWLAAHPDHVDEILHHNRSYIFFRDAAVDDPSLGPIAAAKVPLTPGRSMAVDRLLHTFATPFYVDAPSLNSFGELFRRLMIAQDTGSAIVGPARGDLFAGSGDAAGEIAGVVRNDADFYALLPRPLVESGAP